MTFVGRAVAGLLLAAALSIGVTDAQDAGGSTGRRERLIGLLDFPDLLAANPCGRERAGSRSVYDAPSAAAAPIGVIELLLAERSPTGDQCWSAQLMFRRGTAVPDPLPTLESDYEIPAAIVYERKGVWFRVALPRGSGWLRQERDGAYLPYPDLLRDDRLTYVRRGWDRIFWRAPAGSPMPIARAWSAYAHDDLSVDLLAVRQVGSETWIQVRLGISDCGDPVSGLPETIGWLPAYRADGETSVWFYSRGC